MKAEMTNHTDPNWKAPEESLLYGMIDNDMKGENKGATAYVTQTFHFKTNDSREEFVKRAIKIYDIIQSQLVKGQ